MKVALEFPPHNCLVAVHLAELRGDNIYIAKTAEPVFERAGGRNEGVIFRKEPWLTMEPEAMIEFHTSLTKELQRLGLIRPTPTEDEIKNLQSQLADARQVRDKLFGLVDTMKPQPQFPKYRGSES